MRELSINEVGAVAGGLVIPRACMGTVASRNPSACTSAAMNGFGVGAAAGGAIGAAAGAVGMALGGLIGGLAVGAIAISNNQDCGTGGGGAFGARSDGRGSTGSDGTSNGDGHGF